MCPAAFHKKYTLNFAKRNALCLYVKQNRVLGLGGYGVFGFTYMNAQRVSESWERTIQSMKQNFSLAPAVGSPTTVTTQSMSPHISKMPPRGMRSLLRPLLGS